MNGIAISPFFISGVIWVNINTLSLFLVVGQERFQAVKVIPLDQEVAAAPSWAEIVEIGRAMPPARQGEESTSQWAYRRSLEMAAEGARHD
jgi:hypothetical protein